MRLARGGLPAKSEKAESLSKSHFCSGAALPAADYSVAKLGEVPVINGIRRAGAADGVPSNASCQLVQIVVVASKIEHHIITVLSPKRAEAHIGQRVSEG